MKKLPLNVLYRLYKAEIGGHDAELVLLYALLFG